MKEGERSHWGGDPGATSRRVLINVSYQRVRGGGREKTPFAGRGQLDIPVGVEARQIQPDGDTLAPL